MTIDLGFRLPSPGEILLGFLCGLAFGVFLTCLIAAGDGCHRSRPADDEDRGRRPTTPFGFDVDQRRDRYADGGKDEGRPPGAAPS